jgi:hypothetical protein
MLTQIGSDDSCELRFWRCLLIIDALLGDTTSLFTQTAMQGIVGAEKEGRPKLEGPVDVTFPFLARVQGQVAASFSAYR